ncbi:MAG: hypothetical protein LBG04_02800 [Holosporaceae bacterium]|jgi:hypothetical protein|nr:hypothetical protein [Holosporaceae bacterium]
MTDKAEKNNQKVGQKRGNFDNFDKLKEKWPSPFVSRDRIHEFTEGLFKRSSMNVLDARGEGITPRYARGNKIFYETSSVISWLEKRTKKIKDRFC